MRGVKTGGWAHNHTKAHLHTRRERVSVGVYRAEHGRGVWTQDRRHMGRGVWQACRFITPVLAGSTAFSRVDRVGVDTLYHVS